MRILKSSFYALIFFIVFISLASFSSAQTPLTYTPFQNTITLQVNQPYKLFINLTNNANYTIYNLGIASHQYATMNVISEMQAQQSKVINITFFSSSPLGSTPSNLTFTFLRKVNVTLQPSHERVFINNSVFTPGTLNITRGSDVIWENKDTIIHSATDNGGEFDITIQPQTSSAPYVFSQIKSYLIYDRYVSGSMQIFIRSEIEEVLTNSPELNLIIPITLSASYNQTTLSLNIFTPSLSVNYNREVIGGMSVKNIGSEVATSISFQGEWMTFGAGGFDLFPGEERFVIFTIRPIITSTSQTNQTYTKAIKAKATNSGEVSGNVDVFVNYRNFGESNETIEDLRRRLADALSALLSINQSLYNSNNTVYIFVEPNLTLIYPLREALNLSRRTTDIEQGIYDIRRDQTTKQEFAVLSNKFDGLNQTFNFFRDESRQNRLFNMFFTIFISVGILVYFLVNIISKLLTLSKIRSGTNLESRMISSGGAIPYKVPTSPR